MCAAQANTAANSCTCPTIRKKAPCAAATSPARATCPGPRPPASDGTFKSADELRAIYERSRASLPTSTIIAYCRIGERSSHTWFVLTYLLGYPKRPQL